MALEKKSLGIELFIHYHNPAVTLLRTGRRRTSCSCDSTGDINYVGYIINSTCKKVLLTLIRMIMTSIVVRKSEGAAEVAHSNVHFSSSKQLILTGIMYC